MIAIDAIDAQPVPATALRSYPALTAALGSAQFAEILTRELRRDLAVDRLYLIDGAFPAEPLIAAVESDKPLVSGADYVRRFLPWDPLNTAIGEARRDGAVMRLRVTPADIAVPAYRVMLERSAITERVSFIQRLPSGWRCMTIARRRPNASFDESELAHAGGMFRLISPMLDWRGGAMRKIRGAAKLSIVEIEERFAIQAPELTQRERQVCARAAAGLSIEGTALDLRIGAASVLTYRKRAYRRLSVGSVNELAALILR